MRLIELPVVSAFLESHLRHRRRRARAGDQHRIGLGGHDLEYLACHRGVAAAKTLAGHQLQLVGLGELGELLKPAFAVGIVEADEGDRLYTPARHVGGNRGRHVLIVLRRLEHPLRLGVRRIDDPRRRRHRDGRRFRLGDDIDHGQRIRRDGRSDHDVDLVLGNQLARVLDRGRGVGGVIEHDVIDLLAADGRWQQGDGVLLRNAQRCRRARRRHGHADGDVGIRRETGPRRQDCDQNVLLVHAHLPE